MNDGLICPSSLLLCLVRKQKKQETRPPASAMVSFPGYTFTPGADRGSKGLSWNWQGWGSTEQERKLLKNPGSRRMEARWRKSMERWSSWENWEVAEPLRINLQDISSYVYKMGLTLVAQGHGEHKRGWCRHTNHLTNCRAPYTWDGIEKWNTSCHTKKWRMSRSSSQPLEHQGISLKDYFWVKNILTFCHAYCDMFLCLHYIMYTVNLHFISDSVVSDSG